MTNALTETLKLLIQGYVLHPDHVRISNRSDSAYIEVHDQDYRLVIGREGRNINALRAVCRFMGADKIEVVEPSRCTPNIQPRPLIHNDDWDADTDKRLLDLVCKIISHSGEEITNYTIEYNNDDPYTSELIVVTKDQMDPEVKRSISTIFGAIGRKHARNIRVRCR